ncbi:hypothetical protein GN956_G20370 [Arapaima gigas]
MDYEQPPVSAACGSSENKHRVRPLTAERLRVLAASSWSPLTCYGRGGQWVADQQGSPCLVLTVHQLTSDTREGGVKPQLPSCPTLTVASLMEESCLEEEPTCPACQEPLQDPHLLPREHSLCLACIQEARCQAVGGCFCCPECQEEHGPSAVLRKSYMLAALAQGLCWCGRGPAHCDACPDETAPGAPPAATKTCLHCEVSLCTHHIQPPLERPAFCNHLLVESLDDLGKRRRPEHEEMFRYYCQDEDVYVCGDCVLEGKHGGH